MINRRHFIQSLGLIAGASMLPASAWAKASSKNPLMAAYLGAVPASDLETRLGIAKEMKFEGVSAPANWYEQIDCKEINSAIRKSGLKCPVAYVPVDMLGLRDLEQGLDRLTSLAKNLGLSWVVATGVSSFPRSTSTMAEYLNMYAQRLSWEKIQFAYAPGKADLRNDDRLSSLIVQTEPSLVHFEWDPGLMESAGADAMEYLTKHSERFKVLRVGVAGEEGSLNKEDGLDWAAVRDLIEPSLIIMGAIDRADANLTEANANRQFWEGIQVEKPPKVKKEKIKKEKKVKEVEAEEDES